MAVTVPDLSQLANLPPAAEVLDVFVTTADTRNAANETLEACRKGHLNCAHTANGQCHDDLLVRGKRSCERKGQCTWDFGGNDSEDE